MPQDQRGHDQAPGDGAHQGPSPKLRNGRSVPHFLSVESLREQIKLISNSNHTMIQIHNSAQTSINILKAN